jgi:hypothetical protein
MLNNVKRRKLSVWFAMLAAAGLAAGLTLSAQAGTARQDPTIRGAGTSMLRGGTGFPDFKPLITKFAFSFRGGEGGFECLALAPVAPAGKPGSGNFLTNVMYVTGTISSVRIAGDTAVMKGSASVTGLGAGASKKPFTATATRGGPGATLVLTVSRLTFKEIVLEGQIVF